MINQLQPRYETLIYRKSPNKHLEFQIITPSIRMIEESILRIKRI